MSITLTRYTAEQILEDLLAPGGKSLFRAYAIDVVNSATHHSWESDELRGKIQGLSAQVDAQADTIAALLGGTDAGKVQA
jgi:hypothetical protein